MNSNWSYSPETVKLGCDLCDLDLWPWPFAWTLLWSLVITPENFMMIRWWERSQKGVTDRQTDGQTDGRTDGQTENTICRAAWSQLTIRHLLYTTSSRAGVKYVLSNTNTNTFFAEFQIQIQIQIHRQKSDQIQIQIQIQLIKYKYKYKYTMRPRQNCRHFTDDILKFIVL